MVLLGQDLIPLIQAAPARPTLVGDWNCITHRNKVEPHGGAGVVAAGGKPERKIQLELKKLVKDGGFVVGFVHANPGRRRSRLDRCYIHGSRLDSLVSVFHVAHQTDHMALVFTLKGGSIRTSEVGAESYWKLNSAVLKDKQFRRNFERFYSEVVAEKEWFKNPLEWFDRSFEPQVRDFLQIFS